MERLDISYNDFTDIYVKNKNVVPVNMDYDKASPYLVKVDLIVLPSQVDSEMQFLSFDVYHSNLDMCGELFGYFVMHQNKATLLNFYRQKLNKYEVSF